MENNLKCACMHMFPEWINWHGELLCVSFASHTSGWQTTYVSRPLYSHWTWHYAAIQKIINLIVYRQYPIISCPHCHSMYIYMRMCYSVNLSSYRLCVVNRVVSGGRWHYIPYKIILPPPPELGLNKELALSQQLHCQLKYCPLCIDESFDFPHGQLIYLLQEPLPEDVLL